MAILKVIEWTDNSPDVIVHKVDMAGNVIKRGSALTVRDSQVAIFCDKGRMADVFLPGFYKLDTDSLPFITKLLSWKYGFETPNCPADCPMRLCSFLFSRLLLTPAASQKSLTSK